MPLTEVAGSLIGAGISGLTSLFGSGMSMRAAKKYNEGQKEIAQMNNQWNAEQAAISRDWQESMMDKQNQWNLDQWNRENEYNSASSQRERLEEAGINPYLASGLGSGDAGSVSSGSAGASPTPSATMPNQMPVQYDFSGVANAINSYFTNRLAAQQGTSVGIANGYDMRFGADFRLAQIASALNGRFEMLSPEYRKIRGAAAPEMAVTGLNQVRQEYQAVKAQTELTMAQGLNVDLDSQAKRIELKYLDEQQQADLKIKAASLFTSWLAGNQTMANIKKTLAETAGITIENKKAQRLADAYCDAMLAQYNNDKSYYDALAQYAQSIARAKGDSAELESIIARLEREGKERMYGNPDTYHNSWFNRNVKGSLNTLRMLFGDFLPFMK